MQLLLLERNLLLLHCLLPMLYSKKKKKKRRIIWVLLFSSLFLLILFFVLYLDKFYTLLGALHHQLEVASQTLALQANLSEQIEQNIHSKVSHSRDILSQINSLEMHLGIEFTPSSALPDVKPAPEIPIAAPLETFPLASNGTIQGHNGTTSPRGSNSSSITAVVEDVKPANGGSTMSAARQGLTIISEMRSHMNMHRQLLKRKNELMSQFPPPPPAGRDKAGNSMPPRRRMSLKKKKSLEEGEGRVKEESSSSFSSSCMVGSEEVKEEGHHHEEIEQKLQSDLEDDYFNILDLADFASNTEDNGEGGNTSCHFLDFSFHDYLNT